MHSCATLPFFALYNTLKSESILCANQFADNKDILKNAPYTSRMVSSNDWKYEYSREQAAYPVNQKNKFWPAVGRIDNVYGDRNLVCSCSDYFTQEEKTPVERLHDDIRKSIGKI